MRRTILLVTAMVATLVLASGVAFAATFITCSEDPCVGTNRDDLIDGTESSETINARAGDDLIAGNGGNDVIYGDNGKDQGVGYGGNDTIYGGDGDDGIIGRAMRGDEDSDTVHGGKGNDVIDAATFDDPLESQDPPVDYSYGESGNDTIYAQDGNVDFIDCGETKGGRTERDTVYYDEGIDTVTENCEIKNPLM
jgi:Ca2+-binding RTX toxin-like protein